MGMMISKKLTVTSSQFTAELTPYEAVRRLDADLQALINDAINARAVDGEFRARLFDYLKEVNESFLESNRVLKATSECMKYKWSKGSSQLVKEQSKISSQTLDSLATLQKCLKQAQQFEEENDEMAGGHSSARTLEELKKFKAAGYPSAVEFFQVLEKICREEIPRLEKLRRHKNKLDKKLQGIRYWRKVSRIIVIGTFAAVWISTVVAGVMAGSLTTTALSAVVSLPWDSMGRWVDRLWKNYETAVKGQEEVIRSLLVATDVAINRLVHFWVLIDPPEVSCLDN